MAGKLADGFDGYGWILCKPGNEGVAGVVKAALDPTFSARSFKNALVALFDPSAG